MQFIEFDVAPMRIVVNHLTRMQKGFMCVAGIDLDTRLHVRPVLDRQMPIDLLSVHGGPLADKQMVQQWIADSAAAIEAARLLTLYAAWKIDRFGSSDARVEIAMIKYHGAYVLHDVLDRALQLHGSLGYSADMPLEAMYRWARAARLYDGPDEVHKVTVARQLLKGYEPVDVPTEHVPTRRAAALERYGAALAALRA